MAWTRFSKKKDMPGGLWIKCDDCGAMLFRKDFEARHRVCSSCGSHFTLPGRERVKLTVDEGSFEELDTHLESEDRLGFVDRQPYKDKLAATQKKSGEKDAAIIGTARIHGHPCVIAVMNFAFMGGSMGMVVGEKISRAIEKAEELKVPVIIFSCSGGARMHEGAISLMQLAKTSGALARLRRAGGFSISVMTHPTTGGVTASYASTCDLLIAEPGALVGFAGPRVIATTIKKELPKGFQRAEFLIEKGQIDRIVAREDMRSELARMIAYATGAPFRLDAEPEAEAAADASTEATADASQVLEPMAATADGEPEAEKKAKRRARRKAAAGSKKN